MEFHRATLWDLFFLFYINDLSLNVNSTVKSVLFSDYISLAVSSYNNGQYINYVNITFSRLNDWLNANLLTLNFNKTEHVQFAAKSTSSEITITYHNNAILSSRNVKFLGIVIESSCTWKAHIAQLLPKLCKACFLMRVIKLIMSIETLKVAYSSYFYSLMTSYGIIFWGNSSFSMQIFRIQKRIIRVMSGLRPRDSCRQAFRDWGILPLQSQYISFLLIFVVNNMGFYHSTSQIDGFNT
jgi:hypothetical protein